MLLQRVWCQTQDEPDNTTRFLIFKELISGIQKMILNLFLQMDQMDVCFQLNWPVTPSCPRTNKWIWAIVVLEQSQICGGDSSLNTLVLTCHVHGNHKWQPLLENDLIGLGSDRSLYFLCLLWRMRMGRNYNLRSLRSVELSDHGFWLGWEALHSKSHQMKKKKGKEKHPCCLIVVKI